MLEDVYPLTPLQEGLYYHWLRSDDAETYLDQISFTVKGTLDIALLEKSFQRLAARHAVLRTFFTHEYGDKPLQVVRKDNMPAFAYQQQAAMHGRSLGEIRKADRQQGFNLNKGSQMRLTVWEMAEQEHEFIWTYHHILMDGWCMSILMNEFLKIYYHLLQGQEPVLKKVHPYSGYLKWLSGIDTTASLAYWKEYLAGYQITTGLPRLQTVAPVAAPVINKQVITIEGAVREQLKDCCAAWQVTENNFLQTAWAILLGKYNRTNDIVFGAVVSGRPAELEGVEEMIGLFINNIPIRVRFNDQITVGELLKQGQRQYLQGTQHHYLQLADIQAGSDAGSQLFDHILVFENYPVQQVSGGKKQAAAGSVSTDALYLVAAQSFQQNNYDLTLTIVPGQSIRIDFSYNEQVYETAQIERTARHLLTVIEQMVKNPWAAVSGIPYLAPPETSWLLQAGSASILAPAYPTVVHWFAQQAQDKAGHTAVVCGEETLSYASLDALSGSLAAHLLERGIGGTGKVIGLLLPKSERLIVALWGILRSGAAYLPLDPSWPAARVEQIMADSQAAAVVDEAFIEAFLQTRDHRQAPELNIGSADLAYVIYTSGSTGTPKGVMIPHGALVDYCAGLLRVTNIEDCTSFGWVSTIAADLGNTVLFPAFLTGGYLRVYSDHDLMQPADMMKWPVDCLKITPSHWKALQSDHCTFLPARCLVFGGEALTPDVLDRLQQKQAACTVYNHYGPAETTVGKLLTQVAPDRSSGGIALGRPFGNNQAYVMDESLELAGIGIAGEICISGQGLAAGYWRQPALTSERFVDHPLRPGEKLYRTGDLGRWLPDGRIEFLGRKDDQVKVRGFRVEPDELSRHILAIPSITAAVVKGISDGSGDTQLAAYYTATTEIDPVVLQASLALTVPGYMIPHWCIQLPAMPLTQNGKIDKRALPVPGDLPDTSHERVAPRNEIEEQLVKIWSDVLGLASPQIGVTTSFFALGGHSLTAIRTVLRIREQMSVDIDLTRFFNEPVIESIAAEIESVRWLRESSASSNANTTIII